MLVFCVYNSFFFQIKTFGGLFFNGVIQTDNSQAHFWIVALMDTTQSCLIKLQSQPLSPGIFATGPCHYSTEKNALRKTNKLAADCVSTISQVCGYHTETKTATITLFLLFSSPAIHQTGKLIYCALGENFKVHEDIKQIPSMFWPTVFLIGLISGCQTEFLVFTVHQAHLCIVIAENYEAFKSLQTGSLCLSARGLLLKNGTS